MTSTPSETHALQLKFKQDACAAADTEHYAPSNVTSLWCAFIGMCEVAMVAGSVNANRFDNGLQLFYVLVLRHECYTDMSRLQDPQT